MFCSVDRCDRDDKVMQENAASIQQDRAVYSTGPQTPTAGSHVPLTPRCVTSYFLGSAILVAKWQIYFVFQQTFNYQVTSYACLTTSALSTITILCITARPPRETTAVLWARGSILPSVLAASRPRTRAQPGPGGRALPAPQLRSLRRSSGP